MAVEFTVTFEEQENSFNAEFKETVGVPGGVAAFETDETLTYENGVLSVNTAKHVEDNNTLPITAAAVATTVGNIEVLLKTI